MAPHSQPTESVRRNERHGDLIQSGPRSRQNRRLVRSKDDAAREGDNESTGRFL